MGAQTKRNTERPRVNTLARAVMPYCPPELHAVHAMRVVHVTANF